MVGAYLRLCAIDFSYLQGGRLFELGACSRLGASLRKCGSSLLPKFVS